MLIDIHKITVNDRIRKDYGDIEDLANDIKENGLINPPVVTTDFELVAGERRLRAMKYLGYQQIEVRVMKVDDAEHMLKLEINENESRKDFTRLERLDYARKLERIERVKAKERMKQGVENLPQHEKEGKTRDIVAEKIGIGSGRQYEKEKYIAENADKEILEQWDKGNISTHKAYVELRKEKDELVNELKDKDKEKQELESKLKEQSLLSQQIKELQKELEQRPVVEKEVEVMPNDYEKIKKNLKESEEYYEKLKKEFDGKVRQLNELKQQINSLKSITEEEKYAKKLKDSAIFFCSRINDFIEKTGGFVWLSDNINELPDFERKSYIKAIEMVENWAIAMKANMKNYL